MYIPKHFVVDDEEMLFDFIEENSFGIVFSTHDNVPVATHLPLLLDRKNGYLFGHFARPNKQWETMMNQQVLAVFQGPHHYISSSWYETHLSVPTWNYVAVHVYGTVELMEHKTLLKSLNDMITKYEEEKNAYRIDETNQDFIHNLMNGIVGFKMKITKMEGKWKLSQNHSKDRQALVIQHLEQIQTDNAQKIAEWMKKNG